MTGTVFDIAQMTVNDGPGVRTTVFLKGCPLRCQWCHNPEGLSPEPELMVTPNGCLRCGACKRACPHPERCTGCGSCVLVCPAQVRRICGKRYTPEELAALLLKDREILTALGGGVTFSGGEPTAQSAFLTAVLDLLPGMHRAIETSGYCQSDRFQAVLDRADYIFMDIKLVNCDKHRFYTGVDNNLILQNLERVKGCGKPFCIRVPLIPGVNDDRENLEQTAALLVDCPSLERVELLPYHRTAGAKYSMVGRAYQPGFDQTREPRTDREPFERLGIPCSIL